MKSNKTNPMKPCPNDVIISPIPLPEYQNGIFSAKPTPAHRTGIVQAIGAEVEGIEAGQKVLYVSRNCVEIDGNQIVNFEAVEAIL